MFVIESLDKAHKLALDKRVIAGIINCPIDKRLLNFNKETGVTEFWLLNVK